MTQSIRMSFFASGLEEVSYFAKNYESLCKNTLKDSIRVIAERITNDAKQNAPIDTGRLKNSIAFRRISNEQYRVYVKPIKAESYSFKETSPKERTVKLASIPKSVRSSSSRNIYPIAQELGYKPHKIKRSWATEGSRLRMNNQRSGAIFVKKFTPYLMPAVIRGTAKDEKTMGKMFDREYTRLLRGIKRRGGTMGFKSVPGTSSLSGSVIRTWNTTK